MQYHINNRWHMESIMWRTKMFFVSPFFFNSVTIFFSSPSGAFRSSMAAVWWMINMWTLSTYFLICRFVGWLCPSGCMEPGRYVFCRHDDGSFLVDVMDIIWMSQQQPTNRHPSADRYAPPTAPLRILASWILSLSHLHPSPRSPHCETMDGSWKICRTEEEPATSGRENSSGSQPSSRPCAAANTHMRDEIVINHKKRWQRVASILPLYRHHQMSIWTIITLIIIQITS